MPTQITAACFDASLPYPCETRLLEVELLGSLKPLRSSESQTGEPWLHTSLTGKSTAFQASKLLAGSLCFRLRFALGLCLCLGFSPCFGFGLCFGFGRFRRFSCRLVLALVLLLVLELLEVFFLESFQVSTALVLLLGLLRA